MLCIFVSRTFVPISGKCKQQTAVSYSFTESEVVCWEAGVRMDGIPALDLRDLDIDVLQSSPSTIGIEETPCIAFTV